MRGDVAKDLNWSSKAFRDVVWPHIERPWFGGGELVPAEAVMQAEFAKHLDVLAGIDAWIIRRNAHGMTGIASRVQRIRPGCKPYNTFTIRAWRKGANGQDSPNETELQKRLHALRHVERGYLYPHVTVQAYVDDDATELLSVAAVLTSDLFAYVDQYSDRINPDKRSGFKVADWAILKGLGAQIKVLQPRERARAQINATQREIFPP